MGTFYNERGRELSRLVQFTHESGVGRLRRSRARSLQIYLGVTFLANLLLRFVTLQVRQSGLVNADDYDYVCGLWCFKVRVTKPWSTREVLFSEARDRRSNRQKSHAVECDGAVESFLGRLSNSCQQTKQ